MPLILILILVVLLGGPALFALVLSLLGVWFVGRLVLGLLLAVVLILAIVAYVVVRSIADEIRVRSKSKRGFRSPLTDEFKKRHQVEGGIWRDDMHFIAEVNGIPNYFTTIEDARVARDTGIVN